MTATQAAMLATASWPAVGVVAAPPCVCLLLACLSCCPGGSGRERVRWVRQQEHRQRQLRQVFVRGDSVVLVSAVQAGTAITQQHAGGSAAVAALQASVQVAR